VSAGKGEPLPGSPLFRGLCVGLLGGSFNPAHDGHRYVSTEALRRLGLDEVWWLVSPQNPLKPVAGMAPLAERLEEARTAARHPRIRVTALEARLGTIWTIDTIRALGRRFPGTRFVWLMGADNLVQIPRWRAWSSIFHRVAIAVIARAPYDSKALSGKAARRFAHRQLPAEAARRLVRQPPPAWTFLVLRRHPAAATLLRASRAAGPRDGTKRREQP